MSEVDGLSSQDYGGTIPSYGSVSPYGISQPFYLNQKQSEIIKLLHIGELLEDYEKKLKGFSFDHRKNMMIRKSQPVINDAGAEQLMTLMVAHCNNILTMSSFDQHNMEQIIFRSKDALIEFIYYNCDVFEVKKSNFNMIYTTSLALIISCLKRAQDSGGLSDKSFLMTTNQRFETSQVVNSPGPGMGGGGYSGGRRGGWISRAMGFMRGGGDNY